MQRTRQPINKYVELYGYLVEVEDEIKLADVAEVLIEDFDVVVDDL